MPRILFDPVKLALIFKLKPESQPSHRLRKLGAIPDRRSERGIKGVAPLTIEPERTAGMAHEFVRFNETGDGKLGHLITLPIKQQDLPRNGLDRILRSHNVSHAQVRREGSASKL